MRQVVFISVLALACCAPLERPADLGKYSPIIWSGQIRLASDYHLMDTDFLIIQPGTAITFSGSGIELLLEGACELNGTPDSHIVFNGQPGTTNQIFFAGDSSTNVARYCDFGENIVTAYKKCLFYHCRIPWLELDGSHSSVVKNDLLGYLVCRHANTSQVSCSLFNKQAFSSFLNNGNPAQNIEIEDESVLSVNFSDIMGNPGLSGSLTNKVLLEYTTADLDLRNNYWGTNDISWILSELIFNGSGGLNNVVPISTSYISTAGPGW